MPLIKISIPTNPRNVPMNFLFEGFSEPKKGAKMVTNKGLVAINVAAVEAFPNLTDKTEERS
jgi:hypothetical protein